MKDLAQTGTESLIGVKYVVQHKNGQTCEVKPIVVNHRYRGGDKCQYKQVKPRTCRHEGILNVGGQKKLEDRDKEKNSHSCLLSLYIKSEDEEQ